MVYKWIGSFLIVVLICMQFCAQSNIKGLDAVAFKAKLDSFSTNSILLDVRTAEEYEEMHIKNAILMDYNLPNFSENIKTLDTSKTIYVYCLSGGRSSNAATEMGKKGFNVVNLNGGIKAWKSAGLPVE